MSLRGDAAVARPSDGGTTSPLADPAADDGLDCKSVDFPALAKDLAASVGFWYVLCFAPYPLDIPVTDTMFFGILFALVVAMVAWRTYRMNSTPPEHSYAQIPYTCGYAASDGKELFIVATLHISPRAPRDVEAVIAGTEPDVAMIELDEERLDRMRDDDEEAGQERRQQEDLQPIKITRVGRGPCTLHAQRALWNAEQAGTTISGNIVFDENNAYALQTAGSSGVLQGSFALVHRGAPDGEFAPFSLKAHNAARAGAQAVLVINKDKDGLPANRIGAGSLIGDLRVALFHTWNCGFPTIPVFLLDRTEGEMLRELCQGHCKEGSPAQAELQILPDSYPRRTLRKRLCQGCALLSTGIGILYGIIQCFNVEVGAEFLAAEEAATKRGIPCVCIDVDLNQFWSRLGRAVLPTPCNLCKSLISWLALPRVLFRLLFPARGSVDVIGSMILHGASLPIRTWIAFILAGYCASLVTNSLLKLFGFGAEQAAEGAGIVEEEDREDVQTYIMLAAEMYLLPLIYEAVAASRDEAMYRSIVAKSRELMATRMVVVVGAAHSNGILQRIRARGL